MARIKKGHRSNLGRWYRIGRLRAIAAYGGGGDRREQGSAAAGSPGTPNLALQGSNRPGLGSEVDFGVCVIHLEHWRGTVVLGVAHAWTAAALSGQARRRAHVLAPRMRLGYGK